MTTEGEYQALIEKVAKLRQQLASELDGELLGNPQLGEAMVGQIDDLLESVRAAALSEPQPPDGGLAQLAGVGSESAKRFGDTRMPDGIVVYDDTINSERIVACGDLYYLYQHERIGVFKVVRKLQELFRAGTIRLSSGEGAYGLYRFDRRGVLRYTAKDRLAAYRRILGYGGGPGVPGSRPNTDFHMMFAHLVNQIALFWRDKRISDVVRERAYDPSFGSIAIVRRAGLDLRHNLKFTSFGHLNVLRVEVMQILEEAYKILDSEDVKNLFGADNGWDVVDEVLIRYFDERLVTSPRQRMGVAGREVLRWLATPHVLTSSRPEFETLLLEVAEFAEEWLTSAQSLGFAVRTERDRVMPYDRQAPAGVAAPMGAVLRAEGPRLAQTGRAAARARVAAGSVPASARRRNGVRAGV